MPTTKVLAVLDWELSTLGDPLSDVAYSCLAHYIPHDSPMLKGLAGQVTNSIQFCLLFAIKDQ